MGQIIEDEDEIVEYSTSVTVFLMMIEVTDDVIASA